MLARLSAGFRWGLLAAMLILAALLAKGASQGDSAIVDEIAHIPAGYTYAKYLDYRLNPEHPPLVKLAAGIPLAAQKLNFPVNSDAWQKGVNAQWELGNNFLYSVGNNADGILNTARGGPIFIFLLLVLAVYLWAQELVGRWWGLLPAFLVAFSPNFLGQGHYVTTDIGAALGILLATWAFTRYLENPGKKILVLAGLALGLAEMMKFSAFLLIPFFFMLLVIYYFVSRANGNHTRNFWQDLRGLLTIYLIAATAIYLVYLALTWNYPMAKQVSDTDSILTSFGPRFLAKSVVWMAGFAPLRPFAQYLLGLLMVLQRSSGGNTVYFLGEVSAAGHKLYFPLVFLMKEQLASLILVSFALVLSLWKKVRSAFAVVFRRSRAALNYLTTNFAEFSMLIFVVIYWASSIASHLNIGIRHVLPTLPFVYILTAGAIRDWFSVKNLYATRNFAMKIFILYREFVSASIKSVLLALLLLWYFGAALFAYPYFLSYFNPLAGGVWGGYQYVTDSNYDWGQDLKRLKIWADENLPAGERIAVDYFGGGNPVYYLGNRADYWWSTKGDPSNYGIRWLAVSINTIQGAKGTLAPGQQRKPEDEYRWLTDPYHPYARAGTSIFIYKL